MSEKIKECPECHKDTKMEFRRRTEGILTIWKCHKCGRLFQYNEALNEWLILVDRATEKPIIPKDIEIVYEAQGKWKRLEES